MRLTAFYLIVSFRGSYCFIILFTLSERVSFVNSYLYSQEMKVSIILIVLIVARRTLIKSWRIPLPINQLNKIYLNF